MKFKDCYKTIIQTLSDFSNWTSSTFNIVDKCIDSDDEDISIYTFNPIVTDQTTYWVGDTTFTTCYPGVLFAPEVHDAIFNTLTTIYGKGKYI